MERKGTGAHAPVRERGQAHTLRAIGRFYTEMAAVGFLNRLAADGNAAQAQRALLRLEHGYWMVYDPGP